MALVVRRIILLGPCYAVVASLPCLLRACDGLDEADIGVDSSKNITKRLDDILQQRRTGASHRDFKRSFSVSSCLYPPKREQDHVAGVAYLVPCVVCLVYTLCISVRS